MSTFFQQTAQAMIAKHIDRFPLLKLDQVIDWQPIEQYLKRQRTRYVRDHRGHPTYHPLLSMFKAVLLGQWHSLSDPEGDVFKPFESRQQAKCACCRLKGGRMPDYRVSKGD